MTAPVDALGASVRCERVVKIYRVGDTDVTALAGLDLAVDPGEMVGVIGPSGCGKSTLLNLIGALIVPTSGTVSVDGRDLASLPGAQLDAFRRTTVGFVWQETGRNLLPYIDAVTNVTVPMRLTRSADATRRAERLLDLVGLGDRMRHLPARLSGGQQQRAAIAVALANQPSLLLADEPTGELDAETAAEVYAVLRSINRELGVTIVVVSHDPNMAQVVDRVVELRDGQGAVEHRAGRHAHDGVVLLVDTVGRIRVPDEYRNAIGIGERIEARLEGDAIALRRYDGHSVPARGGDDG